MDIISIFFIAVGLAMDSFAVCVGKGMCSNRFNVWRSFKIAIVFGLFQGLMPLGGYALGISFSEAIQNIDHWMAFVILLFLGGKMIYESLLPKPKKECGECAYDDTPVYWNDVLTLALATSIDALAIGLIFVTIPKTLFTAVWMIGVVCVFFSFVGIWIGVRCGKSFRFNIEVLGGFILIVIGSKILIEHLLMG